MTVYQQLSTRTFPNRAPRCADSNTTWQSVIFFLSHIIWRFVTFAHISYSCCCSCPYHRIAASIRVSPSFISWLAVIERRRIRSQHSWLAYWGDTVAVKTMFPYIYRMFSTQTRFKQVCRLRTAVWKGCDGTQHCAQVRWHQQLRGGISCWIGWFKHACKHHKDYIHG